MGTNRVNNSKSFRLFGRREYKELLKILGHDEAIIHAVYGYYCGGKGLLVSTSKRLILIDKRKYFVNVEEHCYKCIKEFNCNYSFMQSVISLKSSHGVLSFKSFSDARVKDLSKFVDNVLEEDIEPSDLDKTKLTHMARFITSPYLKPGWPPRISSSFNHRKRSSKFYGNKAY